MPVQSKFIAGREKKPPPIPGPRPILKNGVRKPADVFKLASARRANGLVNGASLSPSGAPPSPTFRLSLLRQPISNGPSSPTQTPERPSSLPNPIVSSSPIFKRQSPSIGLSPQNNGLTSPSNGPTWSSKELPFPVDGPVLPNNSPAFTVYGHISQTDILASPTVVPTSSNNGPKETIGPTSPISPSVSFAVQSDMLGAIDKHRHTNNIQSTASELGYGLPGGNDQLNRVNVSSHVTETVIHGMYNKKTPSQIVFSGSQAVKECEEHTDWANEVLRRNNLPRISDLRKSVGDGFTLPTILEIISGTTLHCVKRNPQTKEERVENLRKCLKFLCKRGVDIATIHPADLEDGSLKTSLLLVTNIRKHFQNSYLPGQNGHTKDVTVDATSPSETATSTQPLREAPVPSLPPRTMPGAIKLPGAIPTPFINTNNSRDKQSGQRNSQPSSPTRKTSYQQDDLIPGLLGRGPANTSITQHNKPHSNLISTTEIGTNGVSQHGVEERRQHITSTTPTPGAGPNSGGRGGILLRHANAKTGPPIIQKAPLPQGVSRAWTASPRQQQQPNVNASNASGRTSVQDRLSQLINGNENSSNNNTGGSGGNNQYNGVDVGGTSRVTQGYGGGLFHGGGSEVFDDGEILVVPPPKARNSQDFELMMLGENNYGPGYRHLTNQTRAQRTAAQHGYVPSKPGEKWQGSRSEALLDRQTKSPPSQRRSTRQQPMSQTVPGMATGNGHDNFAFTSDNPAYTGQRGGHSQDPSPRGGHPQDIGHKSSSPVKADNNDLRNACNKLYGATTQPPPPYGANNGAHKPGMTRGDNFRSSYGPKTQARGGQQAQYSVKFAHSQSPTVSYRPVSAPAPAHMQAYFQEQDRLQGHNRSHDNLDNQPHNNIITSALRESPMGQSSTSQGQLEDSSSSHQSGNSQGQGNLGHPGIGGHPPHPGNLPLNSKSAFESYGKASFSPSASSPSSPQSPNSPGGPSYAIGPGTKYPEMGSRPTSAKRSGQGQSAFTPNSPGRTLESRHIEQNKVSLNNEIFQKNNLGKPPLGRGPNASFSEQMEKNNNLISNKPGLYPDTLTTSLQAASRGLHTRGYSYDNSHEMSHDRSHDMSYDKINSRRQNNLKNNNNISKEDVQDLQDRSIFDFNEIASETSGSVTPPLPPLSPTNTPPDSPISDLSPQLPRSVSVTNVSSAVQDTLQELNLQGGQRKPRRTSELQFRMEKKTRTRKHRRSKGEELREVAEPPSDTDSSLSFDVDDTFLTVESHDTEQPHPAGDILTSHEASALRQQLHELKYKYNDLQTKVVSEKHQGHQAHHHSKGYPHGPGPPPIGRQRRWSIGSSDTSSFRREAKFKPGKQIQHRHQSKEFKNINKRFQRLESHVVTLARSVAHLSSELRTHNAMVNDLESVKKQLQEFKDNPSRPYPPVLGSHMSEFERFRGWVPGLTDPKRVNKLTKFFGVEPPLLELFLKKLGYEKYVVNFQSEHIGMIELPYMTEERLEKIGVPMGPRLRILQEAQLCFRQENFNIYMV